MIHSPRLPAGWRYGRLKDVADLRFSSVDKHSLPGEMPVRLCNYVDVYRNERITPALSFMEATATSSEAARFSLREGDVLLTKDSETPDDIAVPAYVAQPLDGVICGYHLALLRPRRDVVDGRFLHRALQASGVRDQFYAAAVGVTRYALGLGEVGNTLVPVPSLEEQHAVADFLDRKTGAIDALIEKKQVIVGLLAEKRQAVLTRAVTDGLNPAATMRSSGLPWFTRLPSHWATTRLKYISRQVTVGIVVTPAKYYVDEGVPVLRSFNIHAGHISDDDLAYISSEANELHSKSKLQEGDLVAVRTGQPGTTAVVDGRFAGANCVDLIIARRSPRFSSRFTCYFMNSGPAHQQYGEGSEGALQQHFNVETAANLMMPLPPLDEQDAIVQWLDRELARLDEANTAIARQVSALREYRQALITAAVTGQLDIAAQEAA